MTPKELKKLADMCRKAGIKHYKQGDIEFTLTDNTPVPSRKAKGKIGGAVLTGADASEIESDEPTQEDLLFWSVGVADPREEKKDQ